MKYAISIMQPWPWAIMFAGKDWENRTWRLPDRFMGVDLWLHTGQRPDDPDAWDFIAAVSGKRPPPRHELPFGAIVGVIHFDRRCRLAWGTGTDHGLSRWACGPECWGIARARPVPRPIPCRGQRGFWQPTEPYQRLTESPQPQQGQLFGRDRS